MKSAERDGCQCCVHTIRCVHMDNRIVSMSHHYLKPGIFVVSICDAATAYECPDGGLTYMAPEMCDEHDEHDEALAAFHAAELRLPGRE